MWGTRKPVKQEQLKVNFSNRAIWLCSEKEQRVKHIEGLEERKIKSSTAMKNSLAACLCLLMLTDSCREPSKPFAVHSIIKVSCLQLQRRRGCCHVISAPSTLKSAMPLRVCVPGALSSDLQAEKGEESKISVGKLVNKNTQR